MLILSQVTVAIYKPMYLHAITPTLTAWSILQGISDNMCGIRSTVSGTDLEE